MGHVQEWGPPETSVGFRGSVDKNTSGEGRAQIRPTQDSKRTEGEEQNTQNGTG